MTRIDDPPRLTDALAELSERERQVLQALVDAHIATAEPIGSKVLASLPDLGVSPATIRSVMSALHDRGLIQQPHTSAGRIPTDRGFRYYVDSLLRYRAPQLEEQKEIEARIEGAGAVDLGMAEASRVLSRLTRHACVVMSPRSNAVRLKQIELVRLRDDAVLVILVTAEGLVQNRLVEVSGAGGAPPPGDLERMGRYLTALLSGKSLEEGRELVRLEVETVRDEVRTLQEAQALRLTQQALTGAVSPAQGSDALHVEGTANLLEPGAPERLDRMRSLLRLLDERAQVLELFDQAAGAPGIRVFIGEENRLREFNEVSLVTATYGNGTEVFGTLGVIGPTRLDYARVVPLVDFTARMVSRLLSMTPL